jgi:hypothetical protein
MKKKISPIKLPVVLFTLLFLVVLGLSLCRVGTLLPLYTNADLRVRVQQKIEEFAEQKGILLSSVQITSVTPTAVDVSVREYRRGWDTITHETLSLGPAAPKP